MTADSETSEGKERTNKNRWKKDYWKKRIWMGEKGKEEKIEKRCWWKPGRKKGKKAWKIWKAAKVVKWCKARKIDKQLKPKSENVLKWKSAVEKADEKAAKFHP